MKVLIRGSAAKTLPALLKGIHRLTLVAGLGLSMFPLFVYVESSWAQWKGNKELALKSSLVNREKIVELNSISKPRKNRLPQGSVLGKFEIPRLNLSYILLEGTDQATLDKSIGHIEGTAHIGESGNIGIAGHRNTHFRKLEYIRPGDEIVLTSPTATSHYAVEWIQLYTPEDSQVLDPSNGPAVTLVTCFPFEYVGSAPKRYVVRALPITKPTEEVLDTK